MKSKFLFYLAIVFVIIAVNTGDLLYTFLAVHLSTLAVVLFFYKLDMKSEEN